MYVLWNEIKYLETITREEVGITSILKGLMDTHM